MSGRKDVVLENTLWIHIDCWLTVRNWSWINPKADLQALVIVGREDNLVAAFVLPLTEIVQGKGAPRHTLKLYFNLGVSDLATHNITSLAAPCVTKVCMASKAASVACV